MPVNFHREIVKGDQNLSLSIFTNIISHGPFLLGNAWKVLVTIARDNILYAACLASYSLFFFLFNIALLLEHGLWIMSHYHLSRCQWASSQCRPLLEGKSLHICTVLEELIS